MVSLRAHSFRRSEQPDVHEDQDDGGEEAQPDPPADARLLGHDQHPIHGAAEPEPRVVKRVVHLVHHGRGVADLVTHGHGQRLEDLDLAQDARDLRVVLALELVERRRVVLAPAKEKTKSGSAGCAFLSFRRNWDPRLLKDSPRVWRRRPEPSVLGHA